MFRKISRKAVAASATLFRDAPSPGKSKRRPERLAIEPLEQRLVLDSTVVFNEIMYNPPGDTDETLEWVELYSQLAIDVDISEWSLEGAIQYEFPLGTVIPGRDLLVVAASPASLQNVPEGAVVLGPFTGRLSNGGEELRLVNNDGRVMNVVDYRDDGDWPVAADGEGSSLAKQDPATASEPAESWTFSPELGGTPGAENFPTSFTPIGTQTAMPIDVLWRYDASGTDLGTAWREPGFVDDAWDTVRSPFSRVVISEAGPGDPDFVEIQNVSGAPVDTSGWVAAVNNATDIGHPPDINAFHATLWNLPDSMAPDEVRHRSDVNAGDGNYWGENIFWRTSGPGWAILLDNTGRVADFVVWGYGADDLATFDVTIGGHHVTADGIWSGDPMSAAATNSTSYQRSGAIDGNDLADWSTVDATMGEQNVDLLVPFTSAGLELAPGRTTYYFRAEFDYPELPSQTELMLDSIIDDGAVFYLNGLEVHRQNMPPGPVSYDTLALTEVVNPSYSGDVPITAFSLRQGRNVLAVEVHQVVADDVDMRLGAEVSATLWPPRWGRGDVDLGFNEIAAAGQSPFRLELANPDTDPIELDGFVIRGPGGAEHVLPAGLLMPGGFLSVDEAQLGFHPMAGDKLSLISPDGSLMVDSVRVDTWLRGRSPDGSGPWLYPQVETPGAANQFDFHDEIVINEIMYQHHPWTNDPAQPYLESTEEWIELYNRGTAELDLGGWELDGGIGYDFLPGTTIAPGGYLVVAKDADALSLKYPAIADNIVGNYSRWLSNRGERIVLLDAAGNPADEVHYFESGRWSLYADGGGSSLELRDPDADNSKAEAWAPSDESGKSTWQTYTYRATCSEPLSLGTNLQHFILGLLDEGEFYLDNVSVRRDPGGANREVITNGSFQSDNIGSRPSGWRLIGNHNSGTVQRDPDNAANKVLHFIAAGPQQHIHDHVTTNFGNGETIRDGQQYEISLRAKWIAGSPQVNNRFYFTRMSNTFILDMPQNNGTPGTQNSTFEANVGPTYSDLVQDPVLPDAGQEVTISVRAEDPDGVDRIELRWAVNEGAFNTRTMTLDNDGLYKATISGQSSGRTVQFYVRSWDTLGEQSMFPAAGPESRALYYVGATSATTKPIDTIRIIMLGSDQSDQRVRYNEMSNMYFGVSVVHTVNYGDGPVDVAYHDVEVRQIGSRFIRPNSGYKIRLRPDQKFYGVHGSIRLDMSLPGEIYMKHMVARAGGSSVSMYDDVAMMVDPRHGTRTVLLQLARYEDTYLNEQFVEGNEGTKWELDDIVIPTSPVQLGYNNDNAIQNQDMRDRGPNPESYRGHLLIKNQRYKDDYQKIADMSQAIHLNGTALYEATNAVMDVDLWMRHYATRSFLGDWDTYGFRRPKNLRIYARPEDGKIIPLFWDADRGNLSDSLIYNGNVTRLDEMRDIPQNLRLFWGHMWDLMNRSFNGTYMAPWMTYYSQLGVGMHSAGALNNRVNAARNQARNAIPPVTFRITTNDGLVVNDPFVRVRGDGWIDVRQIRLLQNVGPPPIWSEPLEVTWLDQNSWEVIVPLLPGDNTLTFQALDYEGNPIGTDTISVRTTIPDLPLREHLRITEMGYNPADPTPEESALGFTNNDDFEFIELQNIGDAPLYLAMPVGMESGVHFTDGVDFDFTAGTVDTLGPGDFVVVARNPAAFAARYPGVDVAGQYTLGLANGGEQVTLVDPFGGVIAAFEYSDDDPWPGRADGKGASLELIDPYGLPATEPERTVFLSDPGNWRSSSEYNGSPGEAGGAVGIGLEGNVVVNEVLSNTAGAGDVIELYNLTAEDVDVGGWFLSDDWGWDPDGTDGNYRRFRIPSDTVVPALGFVTFTEDQFNPGGDTLPEDFSLSGPLGDDVWMMEADPDGKLVRFADHVEFEAAAEGESWGRLGVDIEDLYPLQEVTLGQPNSGPRVGPVVFSELMYAPLDPDGPGPITPDDNLEFVEIFNPTGQTVVLTDWHLDRGIDLDFPIGTQIGPRKTLVVLPFDPRDPAAAGRWSTFCSEYGLDPAAKDGFIGGYTHWLEDDGERVQLQRAGYQSPEAPLGFIARLLEDEVRYLAGDPWPDAMGNGLSIHRAAVDAWGNAAASWQADQPTPGFFPVGPQVVGRHVFYNNSAFDGNGAGADAADDGAVAPDKQALLPGGTATFANYTSYSRGINGIMVDIAELPQGGTLDAGDFQFRIGNDDNPAGWALAPAPSAITIRPGDGVDGSDRVTILWPDAAVAKQWLQVTVLATDATALAESDVFYFGNAIGEVGNSTTDAKVAAADMLGARDNQRTIIDPAPIDFHFDFDRDSKVNASDMLIARNSYTHFLSALKLITVPPPAPKGAPPAGAAAAVDDARSDRPDWIAQLSGDTTGESSEKNGQAVDGLMAMWLP